MRCFGRILALSLTLLTLSACAPSAAPPVCVPPMPSVSRQSVPSPSQTPSAPPVPAPTEQAAPAPAPETEIEYEAYTGEVPHIFTHCLIAYPALKQSNGKMRYDYDCINVTEFQNLLNELYANGYSLVSIYDIYKKDENGALTLAPSVSVPKGRKPLVFTIDDVVYDYKKRGNGMVDLLALDEDENLVSGTYLSDGSIDWSYEREAFPILERFLLEHPDFSSHGARLNLAMTGFAGQFGYRTEEGYEGDREGEIAKAKAVANRLRDLGYTFSSHSYGHYNHEKHTEASLRQDLQKFADQVVPVIGPVSVYVYPYGKPLTPGDPRYAAMQEYGFDLFCSVAHFFFSREYGSRDTLYMTRVAIDGYSLREYGAVLAPLFDVNKVLDHPNRPGGAENE